MVVRDKSGIHNDVPVTYANDVHAPSRIVLPNRVSIGKCRSLTDNRIRYRLDLAGFHTLDSIDRESAFRLCVLAAHE